MLHRKQKNRIFARHHISEICLLALGEFHPLGKPILLPLLLPTKGMLQIRHLNAVY